MSDKTREETRQHLIKYATDKLGDNAPEALDDIVHDLKGAEAALINNEGEEAQLKYLGYEEDAEALTDLDMSREEAVHDAKGEEAARINNGGLDDQLEYIFSQYPDEATPHSSLSEAVCKVVAAVESFVKTPY